MSSINEHYIFMRINEKMLQ